MDQFGVPPGYLGTVSGTGQPRWRSEAGATSPREAHLPPQPGPDRVVTREPPRLAPGPIGSQVGCHSPTLGQASLLYLPLRRSGMPALRDRDRAVGIRAGRVKDAPGQEVLPGSGGGRDEDLHRERLRAVRDDRGCCRAVEQIGADRGAGVLQPL